MIFSIEHLLVVKSGVETTPRRFGTAHFHRKMDARRLRITAPKAALAAPRRIHNVAG
jgi:hypothetical protein